VRKADNLPPSCAVVMKSGNLNFLEPSEPVQACNGTDLPFAYHCILQSMEIPVPNFLFLYLGIVIRFFECGGWGARGFFVLCNVQTLYGAHPGFRLITTGEFLWGVKLTTHFHLASRASSPSLKRTDNCTFVAASFRTVQ